MRGNREIAEAYLGWYSVIVPKWQLRNEALRNLYLFSNIMNLKQIKNIKFV
jgi:hypothetical protein